VRKIRVVHIIDDLGAGGAQRQLVELLLGADQEYFDHRVCSLSSERAARAQLLADRGFAIAYVAQRGRLDLRAGVRLLRYLRANRPEIVQTWLFTADLYGRVTARLSRAPVVISSVRSTDPAKPRHHVWADRLLDHWTDRFIVNARSVGQRLEERERVDPGRIVVIYNGVDTVRFARGGDPTAVRKNLGWSRNHEVVGFVGRMRPEKRADLFVSAAARVHARRPSARFLIVGGGPEQGSVERQIDDLGLGRVVAIIPFQLDVVPVFRALDVLVSPSDFEGCSNVILEAMASRVPVVATDVGGNRELIGETDGRLVPANDPAALADMVEETLADPQGRRARAASAERRARDQFSLERMVGEHEALYRELLDHRGSSAT